MKYFGYGSNLDLDDWKDWCQRNEKNPNSINALPGIFILPDHELSFHYYSGGRGGGALDVVSQIGHAVAGKLFEVSDGYDALDKKEGAPNYYERKEVQVLSENGETQSAITYVVTSDKIKKDHQIPGPGYLEAVEKGYENFGISKMYPWATKQLCASGKGFVKSSGVEHLFTYGTLREGEERAFILSEFSKKIWKDCKIKGRLIDLSGSFPGLIEGEDLVVGEIHHTPNIKETLEELDDIEGFYGYGKENSLFRRVLVRCNDIDCWTYLWAGKPDAGQIIESGDWCMRKKGGENE